MATPTLQELIDALQIPVKALRDAVAEVAKRNPALAAQCAAFTQILDNIFTGDTTNMLAEVRQLGLNIVTLAQTGAGPIDPAETDTL
jgi:hypothetical protein